MKFKLLISIIAFAHLTGCASAIVSGVCAANKGENDPAVRTYEFTAELSTKNGTLTKSATMECKPSHYYCGGGSWYPSFPKRENSVFSIVLDQQRTLSLSYPGCGYSEGAGIAYKEIDNLPISKLTYDEDTYLLSPSELRQRTSLETYGVRLDSYKIRARN
ncbi:hypothetical protein [Microbulbifer sp. JMSA003]|uniref:hypothetical protein n=1 Tax=Microbulbifer sp. JMSA003 TaxID=3243369 RepID=UPI0040399307